jgi:sec-independent protein translocase protein TatA
MPGFIGVREIVLLLVIVLLFAGTKRIPELGRSLGRGLREFRAGLTGKDRAARGMLEETSD